MTETAVIGVALSVVAITSLLSGIFGLLGGFLLIGLLIAILDLTTGNLLISTMLIATNFWRTFYWVSHVRWRIVLLTAFGGTMAFLVIVTSGLRPTKPWILIIIGATPFLVNLLPKQIWPNIDTRMGQLSCGFICGLCQILGAASAAVVDMFFQKSILNRIENVALKGALVIPVLVFRASFFYDCGVSRPWNDDKLVAILGLPLCRPHRDRRNTLRWSGADEDVYGQGFHCFKLAPFAPCECRFLSTGVVVALADLTKGRHTELNPQRTIARNGR